MANALLAGKWLRCVLAELPELAELAKLPESAGIIAKQYGRRMSPTRHLSIRLDYGDGLRLGVLRPRSCA
jgi:hypothetical protein